MANKFLGLDSINVLTSYIDQAVSKKTENSLVLTVQAYRYIPFNETVETPTGGGFDFNFGAVVWPDGGWSSLADVVSDIDDLNDALSKGSIYMSSAVVTGGDDVIWSRPMRISGQNGVSIKFAYSYDINADETTRTNRPSGVNTNNRIEYVWMKEADGDWEGPTIWSMYSKDSSDVYYRYRVTADSTVPTAPSSDIDSNWTNSISSSLTAENPFMWMSCKRVPAGDESANVLWSEPILFGHYGMDGANGQDGADGNAPNYNITLYKYSESYLRPSQPTLGSYDNETGKFEFVGLESFRENNPDWLTVPTLGPIVPDIDVENTIGVDDIENLNTNLIDGKTLKLMSDIVTPTPIIISEGNVTIDLNGHNITAGTLMESNREVLEGNTDS
jgi:hypothetical protein